MPRAFVRLQDRRGRDWYFVWLTIIDGPTSFAMTREELITHIRENHADEGPAWRKKMLARLDKTGTTFPGMTASDTIEGNAAGPDDTTLSAEEICEQYVSGDSMNPIEMIEQQIRTALDKVSTQVRRPRDEENGYWYIDVTRGSNVVVIEYAPTRGFGVSKIVRDEEEYGVGPDETFEDAALALARAVHLLRQD